MAISSDQFRDTLRMFPAGVTLVTTRTQDGIRHGMTASSFTSVSADPPLISVVIDRQATMSNLLLHETSVFAVSILAQDQEELSSRFAFVRGEDRFAIGEWIEAETGAPILANALTWLDCRIHFRQQAGSHNIFVGQILASDVVRPNDLPLLYWNRNYRTIHPEPELDKPEPPKKPVFGESVVDDSTESS